MKNCDHAPPTLTYRTVEIVTEQGIKSIQLMIFYCPKCGGNIRTQTSEDVNNEK